MKNFLALLLLGISSAQAGNVASRQLQTNTMSGVSAYVNHVQNDGVENGTRFWTASGGTLTTTSTAGSGVLAGSWDSSAAAQTMCSALKTIQGSDQNVNHEAGFMLQCPSGTCTHKIEIQDGSSNVLFSQPMTSGSTYIPNYYASGPGGTGSKKLCLTSVASNEPIVYFDDAYLGKNRSAGTVSQPTLVGTIKITGCAANFSGTTASYSNFATQTGCSYAVTGAVEAPTTNVPAVRLRNQPGGKYLFKYTGQLKADAASDCAYRFSDGTNSTIEDGYLEGGSTESNFAPYTDGSVDISNGITDSTFNLQYKKISSGTCRVYGTNTYPGVIKVYRFPSSSEIAVRPELLANSWSGYHDTDCQWTTTSASFADPANDASCTFTQKTNSNFGTVTTSGASTPGIVWTPKKTGNYFVCSDTTMRNTSTGNQMGIQLTDGTTVVAGPSVQNESGTTNDQVASICGIYNVTSLSQVTLKLQFKTNGGTLTINGTNSTRTSWSIFALDQSLPAPVLVGSVTSQSTGAIRLESALVSSSCTSTPCTIASQSGGFTSITRGGTGNYTLNYSGAFSTSPSCAVFCLDSSVNCSVSYTAVSSTALTFQSYTASTNSGKDVGFSAICTGPKGSL